MFVKKSTAVALEEEIKRLQELIVEDHSHIEQLEAALENKARDNADLSATLEQKYVLTDNLAKRIDELEAGISEKADETTATLHISDDLETVTPVTRVRSETINKLVEKKYLPYNKRDDDFAINLAVMLVAYEAMEQIVFSFEEALKENVEFSEGENDDT